MLTFSLTHHSLGTPVLFKHINVCYAKDTIVSSLCFSCLVLKCLLSRTNAAEHIPLDIISIMNLILKSMVFFNVEQ